MTAAQVQAAVGAALMALGLVVMLAPAGGVTACLLLASGAVIACGAGDSAA